MPADEIALSLRKVLGRCFYGLIAILMGVIALFMASWRLAAGWPATCTGASPWWRPL